MNIIVLTTKRLKLEIINEGHIDDLYSLLSNQNVQKYFPKTLNQIETKEFYDKIQERYKSDGYCFLAVIRKNDMAFVGICGVLKQVIDGKIEAEIGYRLLDKYWGNGYGVEAAKGCIKFAKKQLNKESIISLIRPQNTPSVRVAEKCGLSFEKETIFLGSTHHVYRLKLKE